MHNLTDKKGINSTFPIDPYTEAHRSSNHHCSIEVEYESRAPGILVSGGAGNNRGHVVGNCNAVTVCSIWLENSSRGVQLGEVVPGSRGHSSLCEREHGTFAGGQCGEAIGANSAELASSIESHRLAKGISGVHAVGRQQRGQILRSGSRRPA